MTKLLRRDLSSNSISFDGNSSWSKWSFSTLLICVFGFSISSLSWFWMNSRLFQNSPMLAGILSVRSLIAWSLDWISSVIVFSWFWTPFWTSVLTSLITLLVFSARDISSFVRDVSDVRLLSCLEIFLVFSAIVGVDLHLFETSVELTREKCYIEKYKLKILAVYHKWNGSNAYLINLMLNSVNMP